MLKQSGIHLSILLLAPVDQHPRILLPKNRVVLQSVSLRFSSDSAVCHLFAAPPHRPWIGKVHFANPGR